MEIKYFKKLLKCYFKPVAEKEGFNYREVNSGVFFERNKNNRLERTGIGIRNYGTSHCFGPDFGQIRFDKVEIILDKIIDNNSFDYSNTGSIFCKKEINYEPLANLISNEKDFYRVAPLYLYIPQ